MTNTALQWNPALESQYQAHIKESALRSYRQVTIIAGVIVLPGVLLDWMTHPLFLRQLAFIRVVTALTSFTLYPAHKLSFVKKHPLPCIIFFFCGLSACVTSMCLLLEGYQSPYYAGINLILLVASVLIPGSALYLLAAVLLILATYYVPILIQAHFVVARMDLFVNNLSFFIWTSALVLCCGKLRDRIQRETYLAQQSLQQANQQLREGEEMRSRFFANISHELRTPLALILEITKKIGIEAGANLDQKHQDALGVVRRHAKALLKHVNDLLDIAKLQSGEMKIHATQTDLAAFVRKTTSAFEIIAEEREIKFSVQTPPVFIATFDFGKIERILLNLLSNAFKFAPVRSIIVCSLEKQGNNAVLTVTDNGPGIPKHLRSVIFERFRQVESVNTRKHGGTGLGLAIVKEFAELHGGSASVSEPLGGGAAFKVEIPSQPSSTIDVETNTDVDIYIQELKAPILATGTGFVGTPLHDKTVLIVEDNPDMSHYLAQTLAPFYELAVASNGFEALICIEQEKPDLVLTDVMMPEMSGDQLLTRIRSNPSLGNLPVVVLTAKADDQLRIDLLSRGADDFVMKPFSTEELLARVHHLISVKNSIDFLKQELLSQSNNIETLTQDVIQRKKESEVAAQAKARFLNLVSHEFKTPLSVLTLGLDLIRKQVPSLPILNKFDSALRRIRNLVELSMQYSDASEGRISLAAGEIEIVSFLSETAAMAKDPQEDQNLVLVAKIKPFKFRSDARVLQMILLRLIENSKKHSGGKPVSLDAQALPARALQIKILDQGPGIPPEWREKIFEPFEHVQNISHKHLPGLGLGLAIVHQLALLMEISIEIQSPPGGGSLFVLTIKEM